MENVFPEDLDIEEDELDQLEDELTEDRPGYKKSIFFDEETGDLKRDGTGKVVESSGIEAWIQWCMKILKTQRYSCLTYSDDIGIDMEAAFQAESREESENILRTEIKEALEADPYGRTEVVESVEFQWQEEDSLIVTCNITGMDSSNITINTKMEY